MSLVERCAYALALELGYVSDEREWHSADELTDYDRKRVLRMAEIVLTTASYGEAVPNLPTVADMEPSATGPSSPRAGDAVPTTGRGPAPLSSPPGAGPRPDTPEDLDQVRDDLEVLSAAALTPSTTLRHHYFLTERERLVTARALDIAATLAEAVGEDPTLLTELRDRIAPNGFDSGLDSTPQDAA